MEKNEINQKMYLESPSGFMMPFVNEDESDVEVMLGFGEQIHPKTGAKFDHNGVDFICSHLPLFACATGSIIALGEDDTHENFIVAKYGKFSVKYGHISEAFAPYGSKVEAGQQIATSGDFLHIGVTVDGQVIDPMDFINILFSNIAQLAAMGIKGHPQFVEYDINPKTGYEQDQAHIIDMMMNYLPAYINDLQSGAYRPMEDTEMSLRNTFLRGSERNYFFEAVPSMGNPLGLSERSAPFIGKIQSLIIGDFLAYMASRHNMFVPTWGDLQKKNLLRKFVSEET